MNYEIILKNIRLSKIWNSLCIKNRCLSKKYYLYVFYSFLMLKVVNKLIFL